MPTFCSDANWMQFDENNYYSRKKKDFHLKLFMFSSKINLFNFGGYSNLSRFFCSNYLINFPFTRILIAVIYVWNVSGEEECAMHASFIIIILYSKIQVGKKNRIIKLPFYRSIAISIYLILLSLQMSGWKTMDYLPKTKSWIFHWNSSITFQHVLLYICIHLEHVIQVQF